MDMNWCSSGVASSIYTWCDVIVVSIWIGLMGFASAILLMWLIDDGDNHG